MHVAPAYISDTISWFYRFLLKCPDQPQDAPLYNPARRFEPAALFLCPFLSLALKEWHEIDGKSIESCLLLQLQKTWIRCRLAGGRSLVNLKFLGKKNLFTSSLTNWCHLFCSWPMGWCIFSTLVSRVIITWKRWKSAGLKSFGEHPHQSTMCLYWHLQPSLRFQLVMRRLLSTMLSQWPLFSSTVWKNDYCGKRNRDGNGIGRQRQRRGRRRQN